jgi:hypothetical protein
MAIIKTAAGDREVVLTVADMTSPEPFHGLSGRRRQILNQTNIGGGGIRSFERSWSDRFCRRKR